MSLKLEIQVCTTKAETPAENLSFQFPLNSSLGGGAVRGLQMLIIDVVKEIFIQEAFPYNYCWWYVTLIESQAHNAPNLETNVRF